MLATFVGHKAKDDTLAPFASAARAGVSLFLLNAMYWEYQTLTPNPRFLSEELMEDTWCCRAVEAWRIAATDRDGKDHSGYGWAMDVSFAKA